jgi:hypothetical protein
MQNGLQNSPKASKAAKNFKNLENYLQKSMGYPSRPGFWVLLLCTVPAATKSRGGGIGRKAS